MSPVPGASLTGTMNGTMTTPEDAALLQALISSLASSQTGPAQQAGLEAQQAQQAYQQASQAQAPALNPWEVGLPTLIGGVGSVLTQDPGYRMRALQGIEEKKKSLLEARQQNLTSLRDTYEQKARAAQQLGNLDLQNQMHAKIESIDALKQKLHDQEAGQTALNLEKERQRGAEKLENIRAGTKETPDEKLRREAVDNVRYLMGSYITAGKEVPPALMKRAERLGIVEPGGAPLPGARKPTALEIKNQLVNKNVNVLPSDKWLAQLALRERALAAKKVNKKAALDSYKNFLLNARRVDETPDAYFARMVSYRDPNNSKKPLFDVEADIKPAGRRMFTPDELR